MLEIRPNCELCDKDLPPHSSQALICSFECTFCYDCVSSQLHPACPNCGGNLVARPTRASTLLTKHPASTKRVLKKP